MKGRGKSSEEDSAEAFDAIVLEARKSMILVAIAVALDLKLFCLIKSKPGTPIKDLGLNLPAANSLGKLNALLAVLVEESYLEALRNGWRTTAKSEAILASPDLQDYVRWRFGSTPFLTECTNTFSGKTPTIFGRNLYEHLASLPFEYKTFHGAMNAVATPVREAVFKALSQRVSQTEKLTVLELGAGSGWLMRTLLESIPGLTGHLLDFQPYTAIQNLSDFIRNGRCQLHSGDFLINSWPKADVIIACDVLSNLCGRDLKLAIRKISAERPSQVHFFEPLADSRLDTRSAALSRFIMATETDGFVRTRNEWRAIIKEGSLSMNELNHGFVHISYSPRKLGGRSNDA